VAIYNPTTAEYEWSTVAGSKRDAVPFERAQKEETVQKDLRRQGHATHYRPACTVRKSDVRSWLGELLESVELVNRIVRVFKTLLFHGAQARLRVALAGCRPDGWSRNDHSHLGLARQGVHGAEDRGWQPHGRAFRVGG